MIENIMAKFIVISYGYKHVFSEKSVSYLRRVTRDIGHLLMFIRSSIQSDVVAN